jgi:hypothetical protein
VIIRALDDPPPGVEELRAVLLREHVGRVRDGLSENSVKANTAKGSCPT